MKIASLAMLGCFTFLFPRSALLQAAELPHIQMVNGTGQLIVNGHPFLILGGELGNSSSASAAQADAIIPKLATIHVNTILMPVAWEQLEPKEGNFDFSILDHWIEVARAHKVHLVLLWFGSWKNAFSNYAPSWVKSDTKRFPRAESAEGRPLEILSTLSPETRRCDARAFAALLKHVREKDAEQQTVLMVQVENEVGYLGQGRDRSPQANRLFHGRVPEALLRVLAAKRSQLSPELASHFNEHGQTWAEVFGEAANEVFMAWNYATYVEVVAQPAKLNTRFPCTSTRSFPRPSSERANIPAVARIPIIWRSGARLRQASISTRQTSTGLISNTGCSVTQSPAMPFSFPKRVLTPLHTTRSTPTAKGTLSDSARSRWTA